MTNTIVCGMQWGDEGKGKIVDLICPAFEVVVRYQGGNNAGHTVKFGDRHFALHLVPSGILHPESLCVLGTGMVINPEVLFEELDGLRQAGIDPEGRLFISDRAHVLLPLFADLDQAREVARGKGQIGTTARGIGPAYESKAARVGLRMIDLYAGDLETRTRNLLVRLEREIVDLGGQPVGHPARLADHMRLWRDKLGPYLCDTAKKINGWMDENKNVLFESAQGALLDLDHGTYPYVTSSNPTAGGACTGSGVPPTRIDGAIGVLKAYTTRVGGGPFVTELEAEVGEELRKRGNEFGTTTGLPRRCGWLDLVVARYSRMLNGVDTVALTKLDVLDELDEIKVCVGYQVGGEVVKDLPAKLDDLEKAQPVYTTVKGWKQDTVGIVDFDKLPDEAKEYISLIEDGVGAPVGLISTGPRREETIVRPETHLLELISGRDDAILTQRSAHASAAPSED